MRKLVFTFVAVFGISVIQGQTVEELKGQHAVKKDSIAAIQERVDAFPGWKKLALSILRPIFPCFGAIKLPICLTGHGLTHLVIRFGMV